MNPSARERPSLDWRFTKGYLQDRQVAKKRDRETTRALEQIRSIKFQDTLTIHAKTAWAKASFTILLCNWYIVGRTGACPYRYCGVAHRIFILPTPRTTSFFLIITMSIQKRVTRRFLNAYSVRLLPRLYSRGGPLRIFVAHHLGKNRRL